jgi:hypothetical protein
MAGETRGELAEAIAKVSLDRAIARTRRSETVFWEEAPADSVIKPDLTTGKDKDHPSNLILVNASDSPKESEKKYWRNIGEIFDSKSRLKSAPAILNLVFKSQIKPELVTLTAALCDATHLVDRDPAHGPEIVRWLEQNHATAPSKKAGKEELVTNATTRGTDEYDAQFAKAMQHLEKCLATKLYKTRHELLPLWQLVTSDFQARRAQTPRAARVTLLRRGLARWLVFDESVREKVLAAHYGGRPLLEADVPDYATHLGMLHVRIGTGYIPPAPTKATDQDMVATTAADLRLAADFFKNAAGHDVKRAAVALIASLSSVPAEMRRASELLRDMTARVHDMHKFVLDNWKRLCDPAGCYALLTQCFTDPTMGGVCSAPSDRRVWLYDHLVAILRSSSERNNDFGYGRLMGFFKQADREGKLRPFLDGIVRTLDPKRKSLAERWIKNTLAGSERPGERGLLEWLKGDKEIGEASIACYAYSLASLLREIKNPKSLDLVDLTGRHAYSLWNKLLTHQDFEPLPELVRAACGSLVKDIDVSTIMADLAERVVQNVGMMRVMAFNGGLICCKSVTDSGKDHKRKELCGRARALRFRKTISGFVQSSESEQLFLVVDGTFDDSDLLVLTEAGWDRIFYPDEMDQLVAAIKP